ncbi:hypothetical protein BMS3Abin01_01135 [bacterium BMS3Abin01]|nr:hypothetical protein BMS3Abin01_01135 [bacterium BMS3Abin01]HDY69648.1 hypothetical protein [Actinomycetota bacterium]
MAKGRYFFTGLLLSTASALGITYLLRRIRRQQGVELYFDDGSMLAINDQSSELSAKLTAMTEDLLKQSL